MEGVVLTDCDWARTGYFNHVALIHRTCGYGNLDAPDWIGTGSTTKWESILKMQNGQPAMRVVQPACQARPC